MIIENVIFLTNIIIAITLLIIKMIATHLVIVLGKIAVEKPVEVAGIHTQDLIPVLCILICLAIVVK